ncbi:uncharacterized protein LOC131661140 [Vicia villosa]|uniref:uncharacterized protein LOC131661140 n=1 Tax=Vicia villosa TaxID=3911 RepID=UPI00273ADA72|nr:uncharacterized protein LOC131661140 [Vicia villosa]
MGAATSSEPRVPAEQQEAENVAASTGALPILQKAFSKFANSETNAIPLENLQQGFGFAREGRSYYAENAKDSFPVLLDHIGSSLVDHFFISGKGGINWVEFVKGYNKCCARVSASTLLNKFIRVFIDVTRKADVSMNLEFESEEDDCKAKGYLLPNHVFLLFSVCWAMSWDGRNLKGKGNVSVPDLSHLVLSAVTACVEDKDGFDVWDCDIASLEVQLPAGKFVTWVMSTVPCLPDCLKQYFHARLQVLVTEGDELASSDSSPVEEISSTTACDYILTQGRVWAISITQRSTVNEEISRAFISSGAGMNDNLIYRSSTHGRGLNRFWSRVEGYHGPLLILVAASSGSDHEGNSAIRKFVIGAQTNEGLENKDVFYGTAGCLYSLNPVFHVFPPTGKEKNFVYSHLHPTGRAYQSHPKPVGVAFGGTPGNERIYIDEDFSKLTIRHHAVDKTYQSGSLLPDQGFLPTEALISEVEVWGLGGKAAKEVQDSYKKREDLFTEQRRKIDLKTFSNWEDSPEKMMMNMMSDPNAAQREDR